MRLYLESNNVAYEVGVDLRKKTWIKRGGIAEIYDMGKFDYLLIEASGICEPIPIAQSIMAMNDMMEEEGLPPVVRLDSVITVTDSLRLVSEFECGDNLVEKDLSSEDIENLIIQQLEFCDIVVLNKVDEVSEEELGKVKAVIKQLQPHAKVIETNYAKVDLDEILDVNLFDFEKAISSAGWVEGIENHDELHEHHCHEHDHECCCHHHDEEEHECHCGHHHEEDHECHCGCHSHGESEYGITTFVYYIRDGFNRKKFMNFVENFDKSIIRCKGVLYFEDEDNMSYLFEQAGRQKTLMEAGEWFCVLPKEESDKCRKHLDRWVQEDNKFKQFPGERKGIGEWIYEDNCSNRLDNLLKSDWTAMEQRKSYAKQRVEIEAEPIRFNEEQSLAIKDSLTPGAKQVNWKVLTEFPLCPSFSSESPLEEYLGNLVQDKTFCQNNQYHSEIVKAELSLDRSHISVITTTSGATNYALTEIRYENGFFIHKSIRTFFSKEGAEKYYTLSIGKEWTGGDVLEDFC